MIAARELRIGNIVEPITMSPIMVTGITQQKTLDGIFTLISVDYGESFLQEHLNPIPLTEEWLLRLNFKKDGDTIFRYPLGGSILIVLFKKEGIQVGIVYSGYISGGSINLPHVKYIHQVQNFIFDLTGKELTIQHL